LTRKWTYQVVEVKSSWWGIPKPDAARDQLAKLGQQGWELVSVTSPGHGYSSVAYLKKEI